MIAINSLMLRSLNDRSISDYRVVQKKVLTKFSDKISIRADGLYDGCLGQWAEVRRENSINKKLFHNPVCSPHIFLVRIFIS